MKKISHICTIVVIIILICAISFWVKSEKNKYIEAYQATEIVAVEKLGEDCMLVRNGHYWGSKPYKKGFWFGYVDKKELTAVMYTTVPTLSGDDWFVQEYVSQVGGDYNEFFDRLVSKGR